MLNGRNIGVTKGRMFVHFNIVFIQRECEREREYIYIERVLKKRVKLMVPPTVS